MTLKIDELALAGKLEAKLEDERFRGGVKSLASDRFFLAYFLVSVSQGEAMGERAIAILGQEELASRIKGIEREGREEVRHRQRTIDSARALFPEFFRGGRYRYEGGLTGEPFYLGIVRDNRTRLKERDRYTRLSLYLTTTFGYEVMITRLYQGVADAVRDSTQFCEVRGRVSRLLDGILEEEKTRAGSIDQHNTLLETRRSGLSQTACAMLDSLEELEAEDYEVMAERCVDHMIVTTGQYADAARARTGIEATAIG